MTTHYFVVSATTGDILRAGTCPESMLSIQAGPGELAIQGEADVLLNGYDIAAGALVSKAPTNLDLALRVKFERSTLIAASDWTQLPDVPLATKSAWGTYRQSLRDITLQTGYPQSVIWPTPPA